MGQRVIAPELQALYDKGAQVYKAEYDPRLSI